MTGSSHELPPLAAARLVLVDGPWMQAAERAFSTVYVWPFRAHRGIALHPENYDRDIATNHQPMWLLSHFGPPFMPHVMAPGHCVSENDVRRAAQGRS